jgi:hypothetical protein
MLQRLWLVDTSTRTSFVLPPSGNTCTLAASATAVPQQQLIVVTRYCRLCRMPTLRYAAPTVVLAEAVLEVSINCSAQ